MQLFEKVECDGFIKRVSDGMRYDADEETGELLRNGEKTGLYDVEKTLYEEVRKPFKGVVVGTSNIVTTCIIFSNYVCEEWHVENANCERWHYATEFGELETKECAIVYYANNKSHLVPLEWVRAHKEHEEQEEVRK